MSAGVMAGVDVTSSERSEYFIVGKPLFDVARAEKVAKKGELIIEQSAYQYVRGNPHCIYNFEMVEESTLFKVLCKEISCEESKNIEMNKEINSQQKIELLFTEIVSALYSEYDIMLKQYGNGNLIMIR